MSREGALWIGGLEQYMDEEFLMNAFRTSGEDSILSIKVRMFKIKPRKFLISCVIHLLISFLYLKKTDLVIS